MEYDLAPRGHALTDLEAHNHATQMPMAEVVSELIDILGLTPVAAIGGVKETRAVQQWTNGRKPQRPHVLRFALRLATMIASTGDREMARAWFEGSNPALGDASPAHLLRDRRLEDVQHDLMSAARAYAARNNVA